MKPLEEAQAQVLASVAQLPSGPTPLMEALGLVLAEPVVAGEDVPPFDNSAVDGYAVASADLGQPPCRLRVTEDVPAGSVAVGVVKAGTAIKIMTGAPIPPGADAVVRVEDTRSDGTDVIIDVTVEPSTALRRSGGDVKEGETVFGPGTRLGPRHLGVLASLGVSHPSVVRRPTVAIFSTGDEVTDFAIDKLRPGQIRDSNRPLLAGLLSTLGVTVVDGGIIGDDAGQLRRALVDSAATCDAVATSGGVSMGDYDLVKQVLGELGGIELWRVAMQPAKPFAFGMIDGTPLFGLPGNPVSVFVAFEQFLRPALLKMMGSPRLFRPRVSGKLAESVDTDPEKTVFLRVNVELRGDDWIAALSGGQSSNVLSATADADCFAVVPRGVGALEKGAEVILEMFDWPEQGGVNVR